MMMRWRRQNDAEFIGLALSDEWHFITRF